jgi:hypothetical protein
MKFPLNIIKIFHSKKGLMGESPPLLHGLRNGGTDMAKKRFQHMKEMGISAHGNIIIW